MIAIMLIVISLSPLGIAVGSCMLSLLKNAVVETVKRSKQRSARPLTTAPPPGYSRELFQLFSKQIVFRELGRQVH